MAATLALAMFPRVSVTSVLEGAGPGAAFSYLVSGVSGSVIRFNRRGALLFDTGCFLCLLVTPLAIPEPGGRPSASPCPLGQPDPGPPHSPEP